MKSSPGISRIVAVCAVTAALFGGVAAPASAAPTDSGSSSASATYPREALEALVCLLTGRFLGSSYPYC
ncbi:hypothetical protein IU433_02195 [Nocardia puris]|uniref:hypothetical protein n=1 Tax=Nocardia puris TaxID=208602 RepID=UPI0011BE6869|nr:hypothetical protein [Nocardia puris]MBF6210597.1 hypothetical protein [Nocardia puris]MBF6369323.1 hypothetical protein [Nocardia puris]MBF6457858.1 hypothetical protein [Nocardia puris]